MSSLLEQVQAANQYYLDNTEMVESKRLQQLAQKRQEARTSALADIASNRVEIIKRASCSKGRSVNSARKEAKLYEWKFSDDTQFNGCYLSDLLNKGNLLDDLQSW